MCEHLLGKKYVYRTNQDTVDCISLVVQALDSMGINNPGVIPEWYEMSPLQVCRELGKYTERLSSPLYDGDIVLLSGDPIAFGVQWQQGILYINREGMAVDWKPAHALSILRSYRMKGI